MCFGKKYEYLTIQPLISNGKYHIGYNLPVNFFTSSLYDFFTF